MYCAMQRHIGSVFPKPKTEILHDKNTDGEYPIQIERLTIC